MTREPRDRPSASPADPPFGVFLRRAREAAGLRLRELAHRLGVSAAYLSDVELGNRAPFGEERLACVAHILQIERSTLEVLAAETHGMFLLAPLSEAHRRAGRALMLRWSELDPGTLDRLVELVRAE